MMKLQSFTWELMLHYQRLHERYMLLTKQKYGQSSEKIEELEAVQQEMDELFAQLEAAMDSRSEEESFETVTIAKYTRRRHPGRNVIPDTVETEKVIHDIPAEQKQCECCGKEKVQIDCKEHIVVTRIPARYKKIVHLRPVYGCPKCKYSTSMAEPVVLPIPKGPY